MAARIVRPVLTTFGRGNYSIQKGPWRYIRYFDGSEELYNRRADPNEWKNVADAPEHAAVKKRLAQGLPQEPHIAHYVRLGDWKAIVGADGQG